VATFRAIDDGNRGEKVLAGWLNKLPGINLSTVDPATGKQFLVSYHGGHFGGSADGVITGLVESPTTPHVWECKVVNKDKFKKLAELKKENEYTALYHWDRVYYAQAMVYMNGLSLNRHYLNVCAPGLRDIMSIRTRINTMAAKAYLGLARIIIESTEPPARTENKNDCWFCPFKKICAPGVLKMPDKETPAINCRTCKHIRFDTDTGKTFCGFHNAEINKERQLRGCRDYDIILAMLD
jgi:CRISPR/Cas system-associated exonuclease Cas4 (RecB family)